MVTADTYMPVPDLPETEQQDSTPVEHFLAIPAEHAWRVSPLLAPLAVAAEG